MIGFKKISICAKIVKKIYLANSFYVQGAIQIVAKGNPDRDLISVGKRYSTVSTHSVGMQQ